MTDETRDPPELKVYDGGKTPKRRAGPVKRGTTGRWLPGATGARSVGLPEYEAASVAYLKFPGNHKYAGQQTRLDPRTVRRLYEAGLIDTRGARVAPPIADVVAERVRLVQQRAYGDLAAAKEAEEAREAERKARLAASQEELSALRLARALTHRTVSGYVRASELVGAMLEAQVARLFDVEEERDPRTGQLVRRTLTPKDGVEVSMGDTVKACNAFSLASARLAQAARLLRNQGVKDRATVEELERSVGEVPAEVLNEQAAELVGFAKDLAEGKVRFEDPPGLAAGGK